MDFGGHSSLRYQCVLFFPSNDGGKQALPEAPNYSSQSPSRTHSGEAACPAAISPWRSPSPPTLGPAQLLPCRPQAVLFQRGREPNAVCPLVMCKVSETLLFQANPRFPGLRCLGLLDAPGMGAPHLPGAARHWGCDRCVPGVGTDRYAPTHVTTGVSAADTSGGLVCPVVLLGAWSPQDPLGEARSTLLEARPQMLLWPGALGWGRSQRTSQREPPAPQSISGNPSWLLTLIVLTQLGFHGFSSTGGGLTHASRASVSSGGLHL